MQFVTNEYIYSFQIHKYKLYELINDRFLVICILSRASYLHRSSWSMDFCHFWFILYFQNKWHQSIEHLFSRLCGNPIAGLVGLELWIQSIS